jgi:hypothetical protein
MADDSRSLTILGDFRGILLDSVFTNDHLSFVRLGHEDLARTQVFVLLLLDQLQILKNTEVKTSETIRQSSDYVTTSGKKIQKIRGKEKMKRPQNEHVAILGNNLFI